MSSNKLPKLWRVRALRRRVLNKGLSMRDQLKRMLRMNQWDVPGIVVETKVPDRRLEKASDLSLMGIAIGAGASLADLGRIIGKKDKKRASPSLDKPLAGL